MIIILLLIILTVEERLGPDQAAGPAGVSGQAVRRAALRSSTRKWESRARKTTKQRNNKIIITTNKGTLTLRINP